MKPPFCVLCTLQALPAITSVDYFSRFRFHVGAVNVISPSPASLTHYCVCRQPENPDRSMVECEECLKW